MKAFMLLLLFPLFSYGQTIHRQGKEIVYKGKVALSNRTPQDVLTQLKSTAVSLVKKGGQPTDIQTAEDTVMAIGDFKLNTDNAITRTVNYTLRLMAKEDGYHYRIDSVSVIEKKGGGSERVRNSKDLLKDIQVAGPVATAAEKVLNEMDANFQKLLALIEASMKKRSTTSQ